MLSFNKERAHDWVGILFLGLKKRLLFAFEAPCLADGLKRHRAVYSREVESTAVMRWLTSSTGKHSSFSVIHGSGDAERRKNIALKRDDGRLPQVEDCPSFEEAAMPPLVDSANIDSLLEALIEQGRYMKLLSIPPIHH